MTIRKILQTLFCKDPEPESESGPTFEVVFRLPGMQRTYYTGFCTYDAAYRFALEEKERLLKSPLRDLLTSPEFGGVTRQVGQCVACRELENVPGAQIYTNIFEIFNGTRVSFGMYDSVEDADRMADSDYHALLDYTVEWYVETYWGTKLVFNIRRNNK